MIFSEQAPRFHIILTLTMILWDPQLKYHNSYSYEHLADLVTSEVCFHVIYSTVFYICYVFIDNIKTSLLACIER